MQPKERKTMESILRIYAVVVVVIIGMLFVKLAWMQIIDREIYQAKAQDNISRLITIDATRGNITSKDGVVLAIDQPTFQVVVNNQLINGLPEAQAAGIVELLASLLNDPELPAEVIQKKMDDNKKRIYEPIIIKKGLDMTAISKIEARRDQLPGVSIVAAPERIYPAGNLAGHILGYIGEISQAELDNQTDNKFKMGDVIGKAGLEKSYDDVLRGQDGYQQVEVDSANHPISEVKTLEPVAGDNLVLAVDSKLQQTMEDSFDRVIAKLQASSKSDKAGAGAAVLLDVKTGGVLAMVSRPDDKIGQQNRAIQGRYIPGSTFKMVTAIAALETGKVTPNESIHNPGKYWKPPYIGTTAPIGNYNIYSAIAKSDNVYFQEMGDRVGVDAIAQYGKELGLDGYTGIDLPYESKAERSSDGLPTAEKRDAYNKTSAENWAKRFDKKIADATADYDGQIAAATDDAQRKELEKRKKNALARLESEKLINVEWNKEWHAADTYNIAMGQGRQNYTPLQLAVYVATIASGGTVHQPYVVEQIQDSNGNVIKQMTPQVTSQSTISPETLKVVTDAMCRVTSPGGTAYSLFMNFPSDIKVAAKTGTSQPGVTGYKTAGKQYYDGVFVAFAPADNPQVAFASVVEYGYSGGGSGGLICKDVFEEYFGLKK